MVLSEMGAEVIRVESAEAIEPMRLTPENLERNPEKDSTYHTYNRNKLCIGLDYRYPKGQEVVKRLVKISDMVVENLRPGLLKGYGLDYQSLRQVNPGLIMVSFPGAGSGGWLEDIVIFGTSLGGITGLDSLTGYHDEEVLGTLGWFSDHNSPAIGAVALLAALSYRERTGKGQHIEVAQWEANICSLAEAVLEYGMNGRVMGPQGNRHRLMAPHNCYPCQEPDTWVSICVKTDEEWDKLCQTMGNPAWTEDSRFGDRFARLKHQEALDKLIGEWTIEYPRDEVAEMLQNAGVAAAPVLDSPGRYFNPHFQARHIYPDFELPIDGSTMVVGGTVWKLSDTPGGIRRPGPLFAEHNDYVFTKLLQMSQEEIDQMVREGVIYQELRGGARTVE